MTTTSVTSTGGTEAPAAGATAGDGTGTVKVTQIRVLRSEWTKFRSLRSTVYTLLAAILLMIGIGAVFSAVTTSDGAGAGGGPGPGGQATMDPITTSLSGITFSQLAIGVLGVLLMASEYSTGMIRSSLAVVPRRLPVLWGKLSVFAGVVLVVGLVTSLLSFMIGQMLLGDIGVSLTADGALRSVVGAALYLTVVGLIAVALGALLRNTAAGISTFVGVFFVIPPLTLLLPADLSSQFVPYLPSNAGGALYGADNGVDETLSPWTGFAVLCAYAVATIAAAAVWLRRRDA